LTIESFLKHLPDELQLLLDKFEDIYIGRINENGRSCRLSSFSSNTWSMYNRAFNKKKKTESTITLKLSTEDLTCRSALIIKFVVFKNMSSKGSSRYNLFRMRSYLSSLFVSMGTALFRSASVTSFIRIIVSLYLGEESNHR